MSPGENWCRNQPNVTTPQRLSLAHHFTSSCNGSIHNACLHNDGNYNAYILYKGLRVKHRWWLTIIPGTTSMSSTSICTSQIANEISFLVSLVVYVPLLIDLTSRTITFFLFSEPLRLRFLTPMFIISYILFTKYIIHTTYHTVSCNISHIFVYQNAQWMHDLEPCPSSPRYLYT